MKFDVIIGNPPYQVDTVGENGQRTANITPLYQKFVEQAIKLDPEHLVMITPSRWFNGGKGLDRFRKEMIADRRLAKIVDFPDANDCFPNVAAIEGGVSYFIRSRDHDGDCEFTVKQSGHPDRTVVRDLRNGGGIVLRNVDALTILDKAGEWSGDMLSNVVSFRDPFGSTLTTNFSGARPRPFDGSIPLLFGDHVGYVRPEQIERHIEWVDRYKVLIPMAYGAGSRLPYAVIGEPIALAPGSACTQTYLVAGVFDDAEQAKNYAEYLCTKFVRFLVLQRKTTQHVKPDKFKFVPMLDMSRPWTDEQLYDEFDLTPEERDYIEATIKPRSPILSLDSPIPATHLPGGRKHKNKES